MKPYQIVDRLSLLYGQKQPLLSDIERVVNTEELSSIFTLSSYLLGKEHRGTVNALMNLVYEREDDENVFVLFKVLNEIKDNHNALDALRNFMALGSTITKNDLFLLFRVILAIDEENNDALDSLKNVCCEPELNTFPLFRVIHAIRHDEEAIDALKNITAFPENIERNDLFLIFKVITEISGKDDAFNALKNIAATENAIAAQTELLFRLLMSLPDPEEEVLDAIKNIIAVENTPDLFLLFKIIQAIDPDCSNISLLKSATILKTNILNLANEMLNGEFIIPVNLKKMINRFEGDALTDAFSRGQLRSKMWLVDTVNELELNLGNMVYVCAGWYGVLPALMFERLDIDGKIYSFDIDPSTDNPADTLNKEYIIENMSFKSFVFDVRELTYQKQVIPINHYKYSDATKFEKQSGLQEIDTPTCIINTSCEHIENFDEWWKTIPEGMLVIMQNNNFVEHEDETVVNTVESLEEWSAKLNLSETLFEGTLELEKYDRYMCIGRK
jgi:hypothetical protein